MSGKARNGGIDIGVEREVRQDAQRERITQAHQQVTGPVPITTLVIACQGNSPTTLGQANLFCDNARTGCDHTPDPGDILYWTWPGTRTPDGTTTHATNPTTTTCQGPQASTTPPIPDFTQADFRRLPLPPATATIQPTNGHVLINTPTNLMATATPVTLTTTLLDTPVTVRATPTTYHWHFSDGPPLTTTDPGAPYPQLRTTHTHTAPGTHTITLTTTYTGEYSADGSPYLPIDGTATVPTTPLTITAHTTRNHLVADTHP